MSGDQVHSLLNGIRSGRLSRREFVRRAAILGMSGPVIAAFLAACGADATATVAPTAKPSTAASSAPASAAGAASAAPSSAASTAASAAASAKPSTAASAPASAAASASTAASASGAATPAGSASGAKLKVGLVTDVGSVNDKSFNQSSWAGVQQAEKDLGATIKFIETKDAKDYSKNIDQFVQEKYDVIVTVGFAIGEATIAAAKANPNVKFIGVDQFQDATIANLAGLVFEEDKAGFLAGALAALVTKKKNIGGVFATDTVPPVWRYGEGYRAGAKAADPSVQMQIIYHSDVGLDKTFNDPAWGKASALAQYDKGADIVFGGGGNTGNGALFAAAERKDQGALCIGVDTDQYDTVPESQPVILTSALKLLTPGVFNLIKAVSTGTFKGGNVNGDVGLAPYHNQASKVTPDIQAKIDKYSADLKSGALKTGVAPAKP
jgi:basic membrane protein A